MPKKWANTHLCTSKVTPRGVFWKISVAREMGDPPPFFDVANFTHNPRTSHFAETPALVSYPRGILKHLHGFLDTSVEYLTPSVEYFIPLWNILAPARNISYLRGIFNPVRGIFHTSVEYLSNSVEYFIPLWNI